MGFILLPLLLSQKRVAPVVLIDAVSIILSEFIRAIAFAKPACTTGPASRSQKDCGLGGVACEIIWKEIRRTRVQDSWANTGWTPTLSGGNSHELRAHTSFAKQLWRFGLSETRLEETLIEPP